MGKNTFVHLHAHTMYSILDSNNKIKDYVKKIKELGMISAAITDHGVMYGVIDFYKEMKKEDLKPIIGCEVYLAPTTRFEKNKDNKYSHLILLAENNTGYDNLMKICSQGFIDGFYSRPRVDRDILRKYHEGIICLSACISGEIPKAILKNDYDKAVQIANEYREIFGENNFFLEIQDHGMTEQRIVNQGILRISKELNIPLVATNDCHYTTKEDAMAHEILLCVNSKKTLQDEDRPRYYSHEFYVKSEEEMRQLFPYAKEAIENTGKIAERCNVEIEFHVTKMPYYAVPEGHTAWTYLNHLCFEGLLKRYSDEKIREKAKEQLEYELNVIKEMGYIEYFLIVWDFINWAREHDIPVGPGRGSAAGSLVSYTTGITDIDPIRYDLLFERFLNPERVSMPDIDIDFCYERRPEVIEYVKNKYGENSVCQIVTFGTFAAKQAIKDVGRVYGYEYSFCDSIAKMIPNEVHITIDKAIEMNPELTESYEQNEDVHKILNIAKKIEGLPRQTGTHAAGVVICNGDASKYVPLARNGESDGLVAQFTMTTVEELGLLKMDFLGLRTLTVIKDAINNVKANYGIDIDINAIDYNDPKVLEYIGHGQLDGVFQLESKGMQSFMKQLKPQSIDDIIAGISLYRPGPMEFIPMYIKGKNNPDEIEYACKELEPILKNTYGSIVYQEQVMQIVRDLGGYTLGRSDLVRRAMSKKKQDVMEKERQNFVYGNKEENVPGCVEKGIDEAVANHIYDTMMDFAKYAFNRSHAACYAIVSFQTAYLKCYYPLEYMAALMTSVYTNTEKLTGYIQSCASINVNVTRPDINDSTERFNAVDGKIRFALCGISGISGDIAKKIVAYRKENGAYTDFEDTVSTLLDLGANKKCLEGLILSGAFDGFEGNRRQYHIVYNHVVDSISNKKKEDVAGQISLFDLAQDYGVEMKRLILPSLPEFDKKELLEKEYGVLGVYVSGHPLDDYRAYMEKYATHHIANLTRKEDGSIDVGNEEKLSLGCMISSVKKTYTKKDGRPMAFLTVEDLYGKAEVIVFPTTYAEYSRLLEPGSKIFINGHTSLENDEDAKIICNEIKSFDEIPKNLWIRFENMQDFKKLENKIMEACSVEGKDNLVIYIKEGKQKSVRKHQLDADADMDKLKLFIRENDIAIQL